MKTRSITMKAHDVQAILDGRKMQTRQQVEPMRSQSSWLTAQDLINSPSAYTCMINGEQWAQFRHPLAGTQQPYGLVPADSPLTCVKCPFGAPGDLLYVRERLYSDSLGGARYYADSERTRINGDLPGEDGIWDWDSFSQSRPGIPSIHMPKSAARIWLEVESVRVERLQDISEDDAKAEGVISRPEGGSIEYSFGNSWYWDAKGAFRNLWESLYSPESWNANPFVWVVSFKVLSTTGMPDNISQA